MKQPAFGCQACGNCVLGHLEYVCPQTCPKQMRNGPCGGTDMGRCEVVDKPCIWGTVFTRAAAAGRVGDLRVYVLAAGPVADRDEPRGSTIFWSAIIDRGARAALTGSGRVNSGVIVL